jgi:hypothetical protein
MTYEKTTWEDEVLAGSERFNINDNLGNPIESNVQITLATTVVTSGTPVNAENLNKIENALSSQDTDLYSHATRHAAGGADSIKLDDLAAPDDNTDLDASTAKHGLLPKLSGNPEDVMSGDGSWTGRKFALNFIIGSVDGDALTATNSLKLWVRIPVDIEIERYDLIANASGSCVLDIKTNGSTSICASAKPTLSSAASASDGVLTGWTKSISAGTWLYLYVESISTIKQLTLALSGKVVG